jgi:CheY-like chemotaxis protein
MSDLSAMIVDDHGDSAIIFSEALRAAGFEIEIIQSGDTALERLAITTPDVVILDLCLPGVAGTDILQHIRTDPRLAKVHVIVVTADQVIADSAHGLADMVLVKPVSFVWLRNLATRLSQILET